MWIIIDITDCFVVSFASIDLDIKKELVLTSSLGISKGTWDSGILGFVRNGVENIFF